MGGKEAVEDACEGARDLSELIETHAEKSQGRRESHTWRTAKEIVL